MEDIAEAERVEEADCIAGVFVNTKSDWNMDARVESTLCAVLEFDSARLEGSLPDCLADFDRQFGE
jgi:hypothetical protein